MLINQQEYLDSIAGIKSEIKNALSRSTPTANQKPLMLCYQIGKIINAHKDWGSEFIENLSRDLQADYPDTGLFSVPNLQYMSKLSDMEAEEKDRGNDGKVYRRKQSRMGRSV